MLHLITCTCHGRIMPRLAELLLSDMAGGRPEFLWTSNVNVILFFFFFSCLVHQK